MAGVMGGGPSIGKPHATRGTGRVGSGLIVPPRRPQSLILAARGPRARPTDPDPMPNWNELNESLQAMRTTVLQARDYL